MNSRHWQRSMVLFGIAATAAAVLAASAQAKAPALVWASAGFDYGTLDAALADTASHTFTLTTVDGMPSKPITISLSGDSVFTKTADTCSGKRLGPKKSCSVTVQYEPTVNGSNSATLTASSTNAGSASSSLTGTSAWRQGDFVTYTQDDYGNIGSTGGTFLSANFTQVYPGGIVIGGTRTISFIDADAVIAFLPQTGPNGQLLASLINPTSTAAGALAGITLALALDVGFSDAHRLGAAPIPFGDLRICGFNAIVDGQTVRQVLATIEVLLGGGSGDGLSPDSAATVAILLDNAFRAGTPSAFAQDSLQPTAACP